MEVLFLPFLVLLFIFSFYIPYNFFSQQMLQNL
nr:MAG TPA: TadE-like protein [Caudoviricetes sp.]